MGHRSQPTNQPTNQLQHSHTHSQTHSKPQGGSTNWTVGGDRCWALVISRCYLAHKFVLQWFLRLLHFYLFFFLFFFLSLFVLLLLFAVWFVWTPSTEISRTELLKLEIQRFMTVNWTGHRSEQWWPGSRGRKRYRGCWDARHLEQLPNRLVVGNLFALLVMVMSKYVWYVK